MGTTGVCTPLLQVYKGVERRDFSGTRLTIRRDYGNKMHGLNEDILMNQITVQ